MLRWRIYYDDGSTFDNLQGTPDQAPPLGVQFVIQLCDKGRSRDVVDGADYYFYVNGVWVGADLIGLIVRLMKRIPFSGFLVGRWIASDDFGELQLKVARDTDFPGAN